MGEVWFDILLRFIFKIMELIFWKLSWDRQDIFVCIFDQKAYRNISQMSNDTIKVILLKPIHSNVSIWFDIQMDFYNNECYFKCHSR